MRSLSLAALLLTALTGCPMEVGPDYDSSRQGAAAGYPTLSISGNPSSVPARQQADMNIELRGWRETNAKRTLVSINGPTDAKAPRLDTIFDGGRLPPMAHVYKVGVFAGIAHGIEQKGDVHLVGFATRAGSGLRVPRSGYDIGQGFTAMVLYADSDGVTLKYTREDGVVTGYVVHLLGLKVDPALVAGYRGCVAGGRRQLPAVRGGAVIGRATGALKVAVRDSGTFMDPRSRKDWYSSGAQAAPPPKQQSQPQQPPAQQSPSIPPSKSSQTGEQTTRCSAAGVTFALDAPPAACAVRRLRVTAPVGYSWVMGGAAATTGKPAWVGGASGVSCSGGTCSWTFAKLRLPCGAGPYRVALLADATNDDPRRGRLIASCQP